MATKPGAGPLRERVAFDAREEIDDGYGNHVGAWQERIAPVAARIQPLKGGEQVLAARLTGVQPVIIRVRRSAATAAIDPTWRARDVRRGAVYNIRSVADMEERGAYLDMLCEAGGADG